MIEAGINLLGFTPAGINHLYPLLWRSYAARVVKRIWSVDWILGCEAGAAYARSRSAGENELMRRKTWSLVGLEHPVTEGVGFGELEVRGNVAGNNVLKPWIGRRATGRSVGVAGHTDVVGSIHLAIVVHGEKRLVRVTQIVVVRQRLRHQRDLGAFRVYPVDLDVRAS